MISNPLHPSGTRTKASRRVGVAWTVAAALLAQVAGGAALAQEAAAPAESRQIPESLNFANGLLRDRQFTQAAEEYERFLKEEPGEADAADAHFGLGKARLFLGQYQESRKHFETYLQLAPDQANSATALFRVGETSYFLHDLPAARKALEDFTQSNPKHRDLESALPYLGDVCFQLRDLPAARRAYEKSIDLYPSGRLADRARYWLGLTEMAQGQNEDALRLFADLARRKVPEWSEKAQYQLAQVRLSAGQFAEAAEAYDTLERAYPKSPQLPEARLHRAEALLKLGRGEEAEGLLSPLVAGPAPALATQAAELLATSQIDRGRPAEARTMLDDVMRRFPGAPLAPALLFRSAEAAQKEGKTDLARARYMKVVDTAPNDPWASDALYKAAALALGARDFVSARSLANSLTTRYPTSPLVAEAHLIEARCALGSGQPKPAITLLKHLLGEEKPGPETAQAARYYLGQAYKADGQPEKAIEVLESLAKTPAAPAATDAQFLVGQGHFNAGRFAECIAPLEKYLVGKPKGEVADHALAYLTLARAELGQNDEAMATLRQLAGDFPRSKTIGPTILRMADLALSAKQADRAADLYRKVGGPEVDDPKLRLRAISGLGWALLHAEKPVEAAEAFAARLELDSKDSLAPQDALARARALEEAGQTDEALAAYGLVASQYPKSDRAGPATLARARLLVKSKRPEDAAEVFSSYVRDFSGGSGNSSEGLDTVLAEWGWALLDAGKTAEADRAFTRLLNEHPNSPRADDARLNLAESAYLAKQYDEVARLLEPLVAEDSKADPVLTQSALYRLGRTLCARKEWERAGKVFGRLVADYPAGSYHSEARFWKAEAAFQGGDAKTAEAEFAGLASELATNDGPKAEWNQTAHLRRLQCLVILERWADALAQADALRSEAPNHRQMAEIDYARGRALQGLARFDEARAAYQSVIDARKGGDLAARAQLMRGETYFHQKNYTEAIRELLKVDVLYDAPAWQAAALLEAGKVYERLAQWAEAAEIYKKLRTKFPNDPSAAEAARRLEEVEKRSATPAQENEAPADKDKP